MERVKHFGRCLKLLREQKGMTRLEVAQKAGISPGAFGRLERAEHGDVSLSTVDSVAKALGMTAGEMLVGVDKATKAYEDLLKAEAAIIAAFEEQNR